MKRPPYGLHCHASLVRVIDGDTLVVNASIFPGEWHIRLLNCWAPERNTEAGPAAKAYLEQLVTGAELSVFIPSPSEFKNVLAKISSMERILAWVFASDELSVNEAMVLAGHATERKRK